MSETKKENAVMEVLKPEVTEINAVEAMERANIDCQIATAHKFPRSLERFQKTAMAMVTQDEDTAASCLYSRPVGDGKFAEGMSIRMAEIVASGFGNLRVGSMLTEQTERQVKARGFAHDLESNFAATSEVVESTIDKYGKPYSERMRIVVAKACLAKARRDATFQVVPRALCKSLEDAARKTAIGDAATLEKRRALVMDWIGKLGIKKDRVFNALKIQGVADIGLNELEILTGLKTAIKEGDTTIDEAFPRKDISMPTPKGKGKQEPTEPPQAQDVRPDIRADLIKEIDQAWNAMKPSKFQKAFNAAGLELTKDGDMIYKDATDEQLTTLASLLRR